MNTKSSNRFDLTARGVANQRQKPVNIRVVKFSHEWYFKNQTERSKKMKKMLKLNELNKKEMIMVRGGTMQCGGGHGTCGCGCTESHPGGSSKSDNAGANAGNGYTCSVSHADTYCLKTINVTA